uniref:Uncharacterized protein n=1 Tax=Phasianus colchicus TaxID=9054 RepID=A0A669QKA6_PHACC
RCSAHCSPELLGSSDPAGSASRVAGTTGVRHRARQRLHRNAATPCRLCVRTGRSDCFSPQGFAVELCAVQHRS